MAASFSLKDVQITVQAMLNFDQLRYQISDGILQRQHPHHPVLTIHFSAVDFLLIPQCLSLLFC